MNGPLGRLTLACDSWISFSSGRAAFSLRGLPAFQTACNKLFAAIDELLRHGARNADFMPIVRDRLGQKMELCDWRRFLEERLVECCLTEAIAAIMCQDDAFNAHYDSNAIIVEKKKEILSLLYNAEHYTAIEIDSSGNFGYPAP